MPSCKAPRTDVPLTVRWDCTETEQNGIFPPKLSRKEGASERSQTQWITMTDLTRRVFWESYAIDVFQVSGYEWQQLTIGQLLLPTVSAWFSFCL